MSKLDVSIATHDRFKAFCKSRGTKMKDELERLLKDHMDAANSTITIQVPPIFVSTVPVKRDPAPPEDPRDPWTRPPFWENKGK